MRKKAKNDATSAETLSLPELTKLVLKLQKRVEHLERVASGEELLMPPVITKQEIEQGMGRKPKLPQKEVLRRRNWLAWWLEQNWASLSKKLRNPKTAKEAVEILINRDLVGIVGDPDPPFYTDPGKYKEQLWEFLKSGKFCGNPVNLAGAMAGLPELSWRRSLDISQKNPTKQLPHLAAWRDHLRRNFPIRLRELMRAKSLEQVREVMAKTSTEDRLYDYLKLHPEEAFQWIMDRRSEAGREQSARNPGSALRR